MKRKTMKALLIATIMIAGLTGCGKNGLEESKNLPESMVAENDADGADADEVTETAGSTDGATETETSTDGVVLSTDFVDYLNQKREEVGYEKLTWDDALAETASVRVKEIITDFDHTDNDTGELILKAGTDKVDEWYDLLDKNDFTKHTMDNAYWTKAAAASYKDGNTTYLVVLLDY